MAIRSLRRAFAAALLFAAALDAGAQAFPSKPVRIVIGFPPGGGIDIVARILAPRLSEALGQPVLVENRPGANGVVGMDLVAKAAPDGHTVALGTLGTFSVNPSFYPNLPFNAETAFAPLTQLASVAFIVYANPSLPIRSISDLVAYAKANPGKVNFSSSGNGGLPHLAGEMFAAAAGVSMVHVPYKGSAPSIADVMGGQVQITFEAAAIGLQHIKSGKLRALGVAGPRRISTIPEVPTLAEAGLPGVEAAGWNGLFAPAGTPEAVVRRLHQDVSKVLASAPIKADSLTLGYEIAGDGPEEFGAFVRTEIVKWGKVIKESNIRME